KLLAQLGTAYNTFHANLPPKHAQLHEFLRTFPLNEKDDHAEECTKRFEAFEKTNRKAVQYFLQHGKEIKKCFELLQEESGENDPEIAQVMHTLLKQKGIHTLGDLAASMRKKPKASQQSQANNKCSK